MFFSKSGHFSPNFKKGWEDLPLPDTCCALSTIMISQKNWKDRIKFLTKSKVKLFQGLCDLHLMEAKMLNINIALSWREKSMLILSITFTEDCFYEEWFCQRNTSYAKLFYWKTKCPNKHWYFNYAFKFWEKLVMNVTNVQQNFFAIETRLHFITVDIRQ